MALVKVKPTSAGRRAMVKVVNASLHKGAPIASLGRSPLLPAVAAAAPALLDASSLDDELDALPTEKLP